MKFKVGDKVRTTIDLDDGPQDTPIQKGTVVVVHSVLAGASYPYQIKHENGTPISDWWAEGELEPLTQHEFRVGDRVQMIKGYDHAKMGTIGRIVHISDKAFHKDCPYAIHFENNFGGHDCDGKVPDGHGHWVPGSSMTLISGIPYIRGIERAEVTYSHKKNMEVSKMDLKDCKKPNLKEAKKKFEEERKNAEIDFAKDKLLEATNAIDAIDREIKSLAEERKPWQDVINNFAK